MEKKKILRRVILLFTAVLLLLSMALMTGCGRRYDEVKDNGKYDVVLRVEDNHGMGYIFNLGTDEIHISYPYTGEKIKYKMEGYMLPNAPHSNIWWIPPNTISSSGDKIAYSTAYWDEENHLTERVPHETLEKGRYRFQYKTSTTIGGDFRRRTMSLYITVY